MQGNFSHTTNDLSKQLDLDQPKILKNSTHVLKISKSLLQVFNLKENKSKKKKSDFFVFLQFL